VAARPHNGHRPGVRASQAPVSSAATPVSILAAWEKGGVLDLPVKPDERLVARAHDDDGMSDPTCCQDVRRIESNRTLPRARARPTAPATAGPRFEGRLGTQRANRRLLNVRPDR
jgi:hypothetical protein